MIGIFIALLTVMLLVCGCMWLNTKFVPLQFQKVKIHTFFFRTKLYFIARRGFKCILEFAEPSNGAVLPLKAGQKMECLIIEGTPKRTFLCNEPHEIQYMQRKLLEHIAEYYDWIQVVEVLMSRK